MTQTTIQEDEKLRMFLGVASAHGWHNNFGHLVIEPEDQTKETILCLQDLVDEGLVKPFHILTPLEIEEAILQIKKEEAIPIEQILLTGLPRPNTESYYETIRDYKKNLQVDCTPYGGWAVASTLQNTGMFMLGYRSSTWVPEEIRGKEKFLYMEEFLCAVASKKYKEYKSQYCFTNEKLLEILRHEKLIEEDSKKDIYLTHFGQGVYHSLLQTFNLFRNAQDTKERWKDLEY